MKWIIRFAVAILLILVVAIVGIFLSIDHIVKSVVETQGTEQLKVPTTLGAVNLGLLNGTVDLDTLAIGSPQGFTAPQMFSVGKLAVDTGGVMRLRDEPIHLTSITIDEPRLVIEQHGKKLNFRVLLDNLPSNPEQEGKTTTSSQGQPVKLVVDHLNLTNAHVLLQSDIPGLEKEMDIKLPSIAMDNIGNSDGKASGATVKDVATTVISKMVSDASKASGVPIDVQGLLSGNLDDVKDKLIGAAQKQLGGLKLPGNSGGAAGNLINQGFNILDKNKK